MTMGAIERESSFCRACTAAFTLSLALAARVVIAAASGVRMLRMRPCKGSDVVQNVHTQTGSSAAAAID